MRASILFKELGRRFRHDHPFDLAAQVAYYSLLALFPFAIFLLTVVGYLPLAGVHQQLLRMAYDVMPPDTAALVEQTTREIVGKQRGWLLWSSLVFSLYSAAGAARSLGTALNRAYQVRETRPFWAVKLIAIGITVAAALSAIAAAVAFLVGPEVVHDTFTLLGISGDFDRFWALLRWPIVLIMPVVLLACIYHWLPNTQQPFRLITPGALCAVILWLVASGGFRLYVSHFGAYAKTYGALGTGVALLVWLYLSGLTVIVGGELNAIWDRSHKRSSARSPMASAAAPASVEPVAPIPPNGDGT
jgi:membrane protein